MQPPRDLLPLCLCLLSAVPSPTAATASPDPADAPAVARTLNRLLETAKTHSRSRWDGPSGQHGFITITRTYFPRPDGPCRDYLRTIQNPGGDPTRLRGVGCRDDNGLWLLHETETQTQTRGGAVPPVAPPCKATPKPICPPSKPAEPAQPAQPPNPAAAAIDAASRPTPADW